MSDPPLGSGDRLPDELLPERRGFFVKAATLLVGGLVSLFPFAAGLTVFFDPLCRRSGKAGKGKPDESFLRVATLDALPDDGVPRPFAVIAERTDAWTRYPSEPIGAVYLRRQPGQQKPSAVSVVCPHLGCFVDFKPARRLFQCPCHESSFEPDGRRVNPEKCPAPRDLDELEVELRGERENEIWVKFQKFRAGTAQKIVEG